MGGGEAQCPKRWGLINAVGHRKVFDSWTCPKVKRSEEENSQFEQKIDARPAAETYVAPTRCLWAGRGDRDGAKLSELAMLPWCHGAMGVCSGDSLAEGESDMW